MRTARVYESPNTIPEFGPASHVGTEAVTRPKPTGTGLAKSALSAIPTGCST